MYLVTMRNPHYDEHFFVTQFIKGLKSELCNMVEAQVPDSIERAVLLARIQQEILAADKPRAQRQTNYARPDNAVSRLDTQKPSVKLATGDFWKDRQLHDYRKANALCFKCGDKFDPTHQCGAKPAAALNAMETELCLVQLSEEILNMLELQDIAIAEQLSLSINALAGSESANCLRLRALVGNQVLIILVDSGSSSFLNEHMLHRIPCITSEGPPVPVKLANGEIMNTTKLVPEFTWWCQGETFSRPMRVLTLGGATR
jgi:hypothetical protein